MRTPWIGGKKFHNFHWTKRTSSKKGHKKKGRGVLEGLLLVLFFLGKGGEG
jgi:hypothetical protein